MDQVKIGSFIQEKRKEKGLTQKDLANAIGVSDKTVSKWETGNGMPDVSSIVPLCETLNFSVNELLSGESINPEEYLGKADDTIIGLLQEQNESKKYGIAQIIIGLILLAIGMILLFQVPGKSIVWYFDLPTLIIMLCLCLACSLLSGARKPINIIRTMRKVIIPIGILESVVPFVFILGTLDNLEVIGPQFSITVLSILYSVIFYIIFYIIEKRAEK